MTHTITLIPGDGIGPEVSEATQRVLEASGVKIEWETHNAGAAVAEKRGTTLPAEVLESVRRNKVALKGPIGTPIGKGFKSVNVTLRQELDLYANVRPVRSLPGVEPRFEHRLKTGFVEQTFDFGGRVLQEQAQYQQRTGGYPQTWAGSLDFEQKRISWGGALYLQDRIAFGSDLLVTPGIRVETVNSKTYTLRENGVDVYKTGDKPTTGVIPGIGMVYGTKRANVFGNMHYGFAPPRITSPISTGGMYWSMSLIQMRFVGSSER
jgi:hypothetical protein